MQKEKWGLECIDKDIKVNFLYDYSVEEQKEHCHEFMEIEYISDGRYLQFINGEKYEVEKGDFLFFYVGDNHSITPLEPNSGITNLVFDQEIFNSMVLHRFFPINKRINSVIRLPEEEKQHAINIMSIMKAEYDNKRDGYIYIMQNLVQSLLCLLLRYGTLKENFDERVSKIMDLLEDNYSINAEDIARRCGFCKNHIFRIFKQATGLTIKEYINRKRIQKAYLLLKTTDMSIESIMDQICLNNRTYFYRIFREQMGKTPGQMRECEEVPSEENQDNNKTIK